MHVKFEKLFREIVFDEWFLLVVEFVVQNVYVQKREKKKEEANFIKEEKNRMLTIYISHN